MGALDKYASSTQGRAIAARAKAQEPAIYAATFGSAQLPAGMAAAAREFERLTAEAEAEADGRSWEARTAGMSTAEQLQARMRGEL